MLRACVEAEAETGYFYASQTTGKSIDVCYDYVGMHDEVMRGLFWVMMKL